MTQPLAQSRNWRESGPTWPYDEKYAEWKAEEWRAERLTLELIDMLKTVKGSDWRVVESMADAVSVSNGSLTLIVVLGEPKGRREKRN